MNKDLVSCHMFLYYKLTGWYVLESVSNFYKGPIFLSLVENNPANESLIDYASKRFEKINLTTVEEAGTDQYGFFHSFQQDDTNKPWIFYCHDKHPNKTSWLQNLIQVYNNINDSLLNSDKYGIISSNKYKHKIQSYRELIDSTNSIPKCHRKCVVQSMQTLLWFSELCDILFKEHSIGDITKRRTDFCAGNIFLIRREVLSTAHSCVHENMFNKGVYRTDGEVEHGLERFYFYVSECMRYENLFI